MKDDNFHCTVVPQSGWHAFKSRQRLAMLNRPMVHDILTNSRRGMEQPGMAGIAGMTGRLLGQHKRRRLSMGPMQSKHVGPTDFQARQQQRPTHKRESTEKLLFNFVKWLSNDFHPLLESNLCYGQILTVLNILNGIELVLHLHTFKSSLKLMIKMHLVIFFYTRCNPSVLVAQSSCCCFSSRNLLSDNCNCKFPLFFFVFSLAFAGVVVSSSAFFFVSSYADCPSCFAHFLVLGLPLFSFSILVDYSLFRL